MSAYRTRASLGEEATPPSPSLVCRPSRPLNLSPCPPSPSRPDSPPPLLGDLAVEPVAVFGWDSGQWLQALSARKGPRRCAAPNLFRPVSEFHPYLRSSASRARKELQCAIAHAAGAGSKRSEDHGSSSLASGGADSLVGSRVVSSSSSAYGPVRRSERRGGSAFCRVRKSSSVVQSELSDRLSELSMRSSPVCAEHDESEGV